MRFDPPDRSRYRCGIALEGAVASSGTFPLSRIAASIRLRLRISLISRATPAKATINATVMAAINHACWRNCSRVLNTTSWTART